MRDTTEGLNSFIRGIEFTPGDNVAILDSEHPNHAHGWMALREAGLEVRQVPTIPESEKTGNVVEADAETFAPYVDGRTRAIGLSSVIFHSGQKKDIKDICDVYRLGPEERFHY
ncbi:pyridoxal phosphate-dependent transferase [Penicillium cosmopolitanum]|uniref:Pyridoxal phosphate-dependent transferase n=1 Tax=Penicillium cosmopolitanum TaxID=1131564 RepID=A0A9W9SKR1_9EURO|nr:pyridoxal phosphate-dependent transferase [Penicillium cosmopolitanum]KAJ5379529.1 pyridoxal phosphate-dependent transferase [Penicillium cosmopolitanum]